MTALPANAAPGFKTTPYWWEAAEPAPEPPGELPAEAEVAIIGGGYAGLSAALTLGRLGTRAVVLEAERIGWGASSRSGGMVSGGLKVARGDLVRRFGAEHARAIALEAGRSFQFIEELLAREEIDCHYVRCGRFIPAWTPRHYRGLTERAELLAEVTGFPVHMVPRERQREEIGSDHFFGGLVAEGAGALHPALSARGLAAAARRAGALLVDRARVQAIRPEGDGHRLTTSRGEIRARAVLAATNGYTGTTAGALPWLARRLIPVGSYIIATEPLPAETIARLFPGRRMISDSRKVLNYFRPSPDMSRVLWGGRASFRAIDPAAAAPVLQEQMAAVFPELATVKLSHVWTGNVAFTFDFLPHVGVQEGVHYAVGCQGSGVAMASYLGHHAALRISGRGNRDFALADLPFPTKPFYHGRPWFLPLVGSAYRLRDWWDRRNAA